MPHIDHHLPVLLSDVLALLITDPDGIYIDGTFGRGGHSRAILENLSSQGKLFALDRDPLAIAYAKNIHDNRFCCVQATFAEIDEVAKNAGIGGKINGILLDVGVSSPQLENAERGFSFLHDGPLDMRMDTSQGKNIGTWLETVKESQLADVIYEYGEERYAKRIAHAIVTAREQQAITRTGQLAEIVKIAHPRWPKNKHPATQTFQALRIFINQELEQLRTALPKCVELLKVGGRLAVISFHSLEDRIVKQFIQREVQGDANLAHFPLLSQKFKARLRKLGCPVRPSAAEISHNPRARSAILRTVEKIT